MQVLLKIKIKTQHDILPQNKQNIFSVLYNQYASYWEWNLNIYILNN